MSNARRRKSLSALVLALLIYATLPAFGQETPPPAPDAAAGGGARAMTAIEFIKYGGTVGHIIILCSVVALGMSIERGIGLKRDNIVPPDVLQQLEQLMDDEEYEEAMAVCEGHPCYLTNVVAAGLPKIGTGHGNIMDAMGEVADYEATKLQQSISYINYLASVTPLLGLFGTVTGMIAAFNTISTSTTPPTPAQLAGGIQQALVTTCQGLMVAIPFGVIYFYYRMKVQRIILEVASITGELMERFKE